MGACNAVKMDIVSNRIVGIWDQMNSLLLMMRRPWASWLGIKLRAHGIRTKKQRKMATRLTCTALRTQSTHAPA